MLRESDIFGGKQWPKDRQFEWELESSAREIEYIIHSYKKLPPQTREKLSKDIEKFVKKMHTYVK